MEIGEEGAAGESLPLEGVGTGPCENVAAGERIIGVDCKAALLNSIERR